MAITRLDPTRTTTLRKQYQADMQRRFYAVRSLVIQAIWKQDVLGLDESEPISFNELLINALPGRQVWRFQTNAQKLGSFQKWFQEQINQEILTVDVTGNPWTAKYVGSSYRKGAVRAFNQTLKERKKDGPLDFIQGMRSQFLESSFSQPERLSKIQFLYTRSFEELKGITDAMSQQVGRRLADGLSQGKGARAIARDLSNNITGITKQRARVLARTELIAAHAEGQLDSFEDLNVEEVGVMAEWSTVGDDRVCELCEDLEGAIMTIDEARGLIPRHPNCRCAWIPANVGERSKKEMYKARGETQDKIDESLKAELPNKTRAGVRVPQTVGEGIKRSRWAGKDLGSQYQIEFSDKLPRDFTLDDLEKAIGEK